MKKVLLIAALVALMASPAFALITNSAHDFSGAPGSNGEICILCHTPHGADKTVNDAPLWNHEVTATVTFTAYDNTGATQDSTPGQPTGVSRLCLSCHDNTVAIDAFGGATGTSTDKVANYDNSGTQTAGYANIGTDLSDDHPVGIDYTASGLGLNATTTALTGWTGAATIGDLLFSNNVECASCHDVHNADGNANLLRVDNAGSALCLGCHAK